MPVRITGMRLEDDSDFIERGWPRVQTGACPIAVAARRNEPAPPSFYEQNSVFRHLRGSVFALNEDNLKALPWAREKSTNSHTGAP
jgi:hypothetical protein